MQAQKARATGLTLALYRARLATDKWCTGCKAWHPRSAFAHDRTRADGLMASCRTARDAAQRARRARVPARRRGPEPMPDRDGDKRQARARVNHHVDTGRLPDPNTLPCVDCGHTYVADGKRHEYDHHEGVCAPCHHRREAGRKS